MQEIAQAFRRRRSALVGIATISGVVNLLYLTGSLFMLEVYDRVLPSRSMPTLAGLCILAALLYAFQGLFGVTRSRLLVRTGLALEEALAPRVFEVTVQAALSGGRPGDHSFPVRDIDVIRAFYSSAGPAALSDLPWMPVYIFICFLFHPWIGVTALLGVAVLATIALVTERSARQLSLRVTQHGNLRGTLADGSRRNAEVIAAMGMQQQMAGRWLRTDRDYLAAQRDLSDLSGGYGALSKTFRLGLQSGVLALGAMLVINNQATAGIIIASSILVSRSLAPAEVAIASWKGFVACRQSKRRLVEALARFPAETPRLELPRPFATVALVNISVMPPGSSRIVAENVNFTLKAGQGLGIIGPSASGKSSVARAAVGVWPVSQGEVCIDGAKIEQWSRNALGRDIGYLPQNIELFAGSVAENIARFEYGATAEDTMAAARAACAHDGGVGLSAGQRQRIGLARALYRDPFLVVLDEPNANLDLEGETALTQAILGVRQRGGTCIVVAHRPSALAGVDLILMMAEGQQQAFGRKEDVLKRVLQPVGVQRIAANVVPMTSRSELGRPGAVS